LRKSSHALTIGDYREIKSGAADVLIFERSSEKEKMTVVLNLSSKNQKISIEGQKYSFGKVILTNLDYEGSVKKSVIQLLPYHGIIYGQI
jgi:hypothetical protein